ncbi:DMT family transporter [uncultured Jannaschia sp.]|uniref:DMT family transporter n=1 Tax=uncultured Jannaschia sp. TaxID=293347 RepID=UPI002626A111|nr:DMT family transporter [uncultured Jannaschia sp.]
MRLFLMTALAVTLLAANSLLTRAGVLDGTDPVAFAAIRVGAGAIVLGLLAAGRGIDLRGRRRWGAALALVIYLMGFSLAYRSLDAGLGALILFATVQLALFAAGAVRGERAGPVRMVGMAIALGGLVWLLAPGGGPWAMVDAVLMGAAGLGWAAYSFAGKFEPKPLAGTAGNFILAAGAVLLAAPLWWGADVTPLGWITAVASGAVASGLGYALLFRVLPRMGLATAGVAQLSAPVIAMAGGALLLGEWPTGRALAAASLVLAGIALATIGPRRQPTMRSSGS